MDYRTLNAATIQEPFPLPYMDSILDEVVGHEAYSFLDGFSGYKKISMALEDQPKIAFVTAWGVYVCTIMWFGLRNAPSTFQWAMQEIFGPYLTDFMQICLDDLNVFGVGENLWNAFDFAYNVVIQCCREVSFSLNPLKCAFAARSGRLLGHVISSEGIAVDSDKVITIMLAPAQTTPKECLRFLGQIRWPSCHLGF